LFVASTYNKIMDYIASAAIAQAQINLSHEVIRIEHRHSATSKYTEVLIETACDKSQIFDEVVVTTPLGWLKRNKESFIPPLNSRLSKAIDNISYGGLEKVFISFPTAWWDGRDAKAYPQKKFPGETLFITPDYAPKTNPHGWSQEMIAYSQLPSKVAHPTLQFWLYGANSAKITNAIAKFAQNSTEYYEYLDRFFTPYYSRLPYYDSSSGECKPSGFLASQWQQDKFAGNGSYSNFQVGLEEADVDLSVMREGMPERQIWLAGEHTAPLEDVATTVGAYRSGEAVAKRIVAFYTPRIKD